jgi:hypothetical protein
LWESVLDAWEGGGVWFEADRERSSAIAASGTQSLGWKRIRFVPSALRFDTCAGSENMSKHSHNAILSKSATLRYSSLIGADLQRAHRKASAIERLRLD